MGSDNHAARLAATKLALARGKNAARLAAGKLPVASGRANGSAPQPLLATPGEGHGWRLPHPTHLVPTAVTPSRDNAPDARCAPFGRDMFSPSRMCARPARPSATVYWSGTELSMPFAACNCLRVPNGIPRPAERSRPVPHQPAEAVDASAPQAPGGRFPRPAAGGPTPPFLHCMYGRSGRPRGGAARSDRQAGGARHQHAHQFGLPVCAGLAENLLEVLAHRLVSDTERLRHLLQPIAAGEQRSDADWRGSGHRAGRSASGRSAPAAPDRQ